MPRQQQVADTYLQPKARKLAKSANTYSSSVLEFFRC